MNKAELKKKVEWCRQLMQMCSGPGRASMESLASVGLFVPPGADWCAHSWVIIKAIEARLEVYRHLLDTLPKAPVEPDPEPELCRATTVVGNATFPCMQLKGHTGVHEWLSKDGPHMGIWWGHGST